jgi:hypothetical protein
MRSMQQVGPTGGKQRRARWPKEDEYLIINVQEIQTGYLVLCWLLFMESMAQRVAPIHKSQGIGFKKKTLLKKQWF